MILSDRTIKEEIAAGKIAINPLDPSDIQPASVDLHLLDKILVFQNFSTPYIDLRKDLPNLMAEVVVEKNKPFVLHPGEFVLASTAEEVGIGNGIVGKLEGKSSLGRIGLLIHSTAGYVDPGWHGRLTLELANVSRLPIALYVGMKIGQIAFHRMTTEADRPYGSTGLGSRYQNQQGPVASRAFRDFKE